MTAEATERSERAGTLARRLARYRAATSGPAAALGGLDPAVAGGGSLPSRHLAERLATRLGAEVVTGPDGTVVRFESPARPMAIDRDRLARLPGQPGADVPLVCLDTETTGLATGAGTVAFLIGIGWWEGDSFRQLQLLLPDHSDERALLSALAAHIPADGWLVTYNGRGFDWPLLETRYRMARQAAPVHAGHLDLLPIVRRLFRHRLEDARLRTAEAGLLGLHRHGDVDGWEIPARYLGFLRGGPVEPLVDVVRHNDQDVRSLARLLIMLETGFGDPGSRRAAPAGDLAGLARAFARSGRASEAVACYDDALAVAAPEDLGRRSPAPGGAGRPPEEPWWSPRIPADFGGRGRIAADRAMPDRTAAFATPWTAERIAVERAYMLRRMGRWDEAADAWIALASGVGRTAIVAAIELAKVREHRLRDRDGALVAASTGLTLADRRRRLGRPEPRLEADLERRITRLRRRRIATTRRGGYSGSG